MRKTTRTTTWCFVTFLTTTILVACAESLDIELIGSNSGTPLASILDKEPLQYVVARFVGEGLAERSKDVFESISGMLGDTISLQGTRVDVVQIASSCDGIFPFGPEFRKFCSIQISSNLFGVDQDLLLHASVNVTSAQIFREVFTRRLRMAGFNVTGVINLITNFNAEQYMLFAPLPIKRQFVLRLQLTGFGLDPWSIPKENALLLSILEASSILDSPETMFGFSNVSSDPLSFADILSAAETPPPASTQGRRRLLGFPPVSLPPGLYPSGGARPHGKICRGGLKEGCRGTRRALLQEDISEGGMSEGGTSSIDVFVRLSVDYLNQSAEEFWDRLSGPLPGNTSLAVILSRFGFPLDVRLVGSVTALLQSNGRFTNVTLVGEPLPQPMLLSPGAASGVEHGGWWLALGIAPGLVLLVVAVKGAAVTAMQRSQKRGLGLRLEKQQKDSGMEEDTRPLTSGGEENSDSFLGSTSSENTGLELCESSQSSSYDCDYTGSGSFDIDPSEIEICKRPDGSDWVLGSGSFGKVFRGLRRGVQQVALKLLHGATGNLLHFLLREVEILQRVSFDRNIVQFYGTCKNFERGPLLVMEFLDSGDLMSNLWRTDLRWKMRGYKIAIDVARGLHFLHSSKVIHCDLKSSNILLTREGVAKIADVGLAKLMTRDFFTGGANGTFAYCSPELLLGRRCTEKIDIYSLGIVMWELVTGEVPVRGQLRHIRSPEECPQAVSQLIDDCLRDKPSDRPTAHEVVLRLGESRKGPRRARPRATPLGRICDPEVLPVGGRVEAGNQAVELSAAAEEGVLRLGVFALPEASEGSD